MVAGAGYCPTLLSPVLPLGLTLTLASCFERLTSPFHMQWCYGLLPSVPQLEVALVLDSSQEAEANCVAAKHTQLGLFENGTVRPAPFRRPRGRPRANAASSGALQGMVWSG